MTPLSEKELRAELKRMRVLPIDPGTGLPQTVAYLRHLVDETTDPFEKTNLLSLLGMEFTRLGLRGEEESTRREIVNTCPDDPTAWIGLASFLRSEDKDLPYAVTAIETAISLAKKSGAMLRYSYHERARVARAMRDYAALTDVLKALLELPPAELGRDIGHETDFVDGLPQGAVDEELIRRFRNMSTPGHAS